MTEEERVKNRNRKRRQYDRLRSEGLMLVQVWVRPDRLAELKLAEKRYRNPVRERRGNITRKVIRDQLAAIEANQGDLTPISESEEKMNYAHYLLNKSSSN